MISVDLSTACPACCDQGTTAIANSRRNSLVMSQVSARNHIALPLRTEDTCTTGAFPSGKVFTPLKDVYRRVRHAARRCHTAACSECFMLRSSAEKHCQVGFQGRVYETRYAQKHLSESAVDIVVSPAPQASSSMNNSTHASKCADVWPLIDRCTLEPSGSYLKGITSAARCKGPSQLFKYQVSCQMHSY